MPSKAFQLTIQLNIHTITCPGVWLCPNNGKITLCVFMLNCCGQTSPLQPAFPLLIHEKFVFNKIIHYAHSLGDLEKCLNNEYLYCELVQWSPTESNKGNVLANFQTSLSELLYPTFNSKHMIAGVDVELLMEPCKCFPGIIAPKIEVSTKTAIIETMDKISMKQKCKSYVVNPKTLRSRNQTRRVPLSRQKGVCHSDASCNRAEKFTNSRLRTVKSKNEPSIECDDPLITSVDKSRSQSGFGVVNMNLADRTGLDPKWPLMNRDKQASKAQSPSNDLGFLLDPLSGISHEQKEFQTLLCYECPLCIKYQKYFSDENVPLTPRELEPGYSHSRPQCFQCINDLNTEESQAPSSSSGGSRPPPMGLTSASRLHKKIDEVLNLELVHRTPKFDTKSSIYNNYCCETQSSQISRNLEGAQVRQIYRKGAGSDEKLDSVRKYPFSKVLNSESDGEVLEPVGSKQKIDVDSLDWAYNYDDYRYNQKNYDYYGRFIEDSGRRKQGGNGGPKKIEGVTAKEESPTKIECRPHTRPSTKRRSPNCTTRTSRRSQSSRRDSYAVMKM